MTGYRTEHDVLGELAIPDEALWGVHTARAAENFAITGTPLSAHRDLVRALGSVKQAAVRANQDLGLVDATRASVIDAACEEVRNGSLDAHFVVDVVQGGAGTSTNMNVNEVVANRALQLLGHDLGRYDVLDPLDQVNRSQSTNDVYPTSVRIAILDSLDRLTGALAALSRDLRATSERFASVVKVGRTQLQDAVPMTVGQEVGAWATTLEEEQARYEDLRSLLCEVNLGATAIGTGITTEPGYAGSACAHLRAITGRDLVTAADLVEATSDAGVFVQTSSVLKRTALKASKICNDLRLLSSGPQAGLGELRLPTRQAGSSIMPGKVNPVICEVVNQVAFTVTGGDVMVSMAAEAGQLQLNAFEPVIAHTLLSNIAQLTGALDTLGRHCIAGLDVNAEHLAGLSQRSVATVTALAPHIGHAAAAEIAREALSGGASVPELARRTGLVDHDVLEKLTSAERLTAPGGS